jgi:hypothetical protein
MDPTIKLELSLGEFQALTGLCKVAFSTVGVCARPDDQMLDRLKAVAALAAAIDPAQASAAVMKLTEAIQVIAEGQLARTLMAGLPTGSLAQSISELKSLRDG